MTGRMTDKFEISNILNLMNVIAFGITSYVIFCLITDAFGDSTKYFEDFDKVESFLHPKRGFFFFIWIVIGVSQGAFAIKQLTRKYRLTAIVQYGVQHHYFVSSTLFLARMLMVKDELLKIATEFLLTMSLFLLIKCQNVTLKIISANSIKKDFATREALILRSPFGIQAAWAAANVATSVATYSLEQKFDIDDQFTISMILLFLLTLFSFVMVWNKYPEYATPGVMAYSMIAFAAGDMPASSHTNAIKITSGCLAALNALLIPARYYSYLIGVFQVEKEQTE